MLAFVLVLVLVLGINTLVWGCTGLSRALLRLSRGRRASAADPLLSVDDVAVLIAAHNEELVIAHTIDSALSVGVPSSHVFVASDGSSDATARLARSLGAQVLELNPNRGKAGALSAAIEHFRLADDFEVVMLLDADTRLASDYMATGLPLFDGDDVVAVAGRAATITEPPAPTRMGRFLVAYRERFYVVVQYVLKYGQAARRANVVSIVPGFASMYRTRILSSIDISAPGLAIEDFNMTFEVHAKKLGRIAFHPAAAIAYTQDPDSYRDYTKQLRRWSLGFWQTVRRHGFHFRRFWGALALFIVELLSSSAMLLLTIPLLLVSIGASVAENVGIALGGLAGDLPHLLPPFAVVLGVLVPDYALTVLVVIVTRRPRYLLLGLGFPLMRIVDAAICLRTLPEAYFPKLAGRSNGTWKSPERRIIATEAPLMSAHAGRHTRVDGET
ncbi:glycosyltransferase family 2 protein [Parafrigoribacterium humi]|jgi:cellulose synthase/poly-beta-1,6-N-acetylglucosamine synthase-like glycosyltransferase|uniref:glycosyltransferase family 2 protein n=1 Tax=Parafrigoribacterium humi TaxID=3144664 RepID=UPI0032EAB630